MPIWEFSGKTGAIFGWSGSCSCNCYGYHVPLQGPAETVICLNTMPVTAYFWDDVTGFP